MRWITLDNGLEWCKPGAADIRTRPQVLRAPLMGALPVDEIVMRPAGGVRLAQFAFEKA